MPPVLRPCSPADPCDEHARFGGAPPSFEPDKPVAPCPGGAGQQKCCPDCDHRCAGCGARPSQEVHDRGRKEAIHDVARFLRRIGFPNAATEIELREKRGTW